LAGAEETLKQACWTFFVALAAYSLALLAIEASTSQDFVRHYFSDIEGGRPFFAINTTLSTLLLVGASILLVFAATSGEITMPREARLLMWTQAGMLAFLGFDDRFQLHEALAYRIGIGDHFIMATWAVIEAGLLLALARPDQIPVRSFVLVTGGCAFFAVMMLFDAVLPHDMFLRLSIEDLAKSWAAAFFFIAAWCLARFHLGLDPHAQTLADWPRHRFRWLTGRIPRVLDK
jgi:hypothetical protein